jgi:hypothetical protein
VLESEDALLQLLVELDVNRSGYMEVSFHFLDASELRGSL